MIWSFTILICRAGSGDGAGPATTAPLVILNSLPWHGQPMVPLVTLFTRQPTCVHTALNPLYLAAGRLGYHDLGRGVDRAAAGDIAGGTQHGALRLGLGLLPGRLAGLAAARGGAGRHGVRTWRGGACHRARRRAVRRYSGFAGVIGHRRGTAAGQDPA